MDWIVEGFNAVVSWLGGGLGYIILNVGSIGEQMGKILIVFGIFCIRFRNTKILRRGVYIYMISLFIEVLGLTMI